jgi:hypothetical protein
MHKELKGTTPARGWPFTCSGSGGNPPDPQVYFIFSYSTNNYLQTDSAYGIETGTTMTQGAHKVQQQQEELPPLR